MSTARTLRRLLSASWVRTVAFATLVLPAAAQNVGSWEPAFNHEVNTANTNWLSIPFTHVWPPVFNAIHMALIPVGPYRGHVLVWDKAEVALRPYQRWSIVDPQRVPGQGTPRFRNFFLPMPAQAQTGDLFCAGHAWLPDGRLFVAGGTAIYPAGSSGYFGAALCYQWAPDLVDPINVDFGLWQREPDLATTRWYPSVTLRGDDSLLLAGGSDNGVYHNGYEVYRCTGAFAQSPPAPFTWDQRSTGNNRRIYQGPDWPSNFPDYPRVHLLATGELFCSGWYRRGCKWQHVAAAQPAYDFTAGAGADVPNIPYASSVTDPRQGGGDSRILRIGGNAAGTPTRDVQWCRADQPGNWIDETGPFRLNHGRWMQNAVVLPNGQVFVVGGFATGSNPGTPELRPELLTSSGWVVQPQQAGPRGYHATAMLLPDGRVLVGGADWRTFDYQIYRPPYLTSGLPRPKGIGCDAGFAVGGMRYLDDDPQALYTLTWDENLPAGVTVAEVVLMRPGAVTHHSDQDARFLRLKVVRDDDVSPSTCSLKFRPPVDSNQAPRGWYMLFAVSNQGVPAEAIWVHLQ